VERRSLISRGGNVEVFFFFFFFCFGAEVLRICGDWGKWKERKGKAKKRMEGSLNIYLLLNEDKIEKIAHMVKNVKTQATTSGAKVPPLK
jgi:hypothetical protein